MRHFLFGTLRSALPVAFYRNHAARQPATTLAAAGQAGSTRKRRPTSTPTNTSAVRADTGTQSKGLQNSTPDTLNPELQNELARLEAALTRHRDLYYNQQEPEISDASFDELKRRYQELAARAAGVAAEEVAMPVGAPPAASSGLRKLRHRVPMLSLAAVNSAQETEAWLQKTLAKLPPPPARAASASAPAATVPSGYRWVVEPKVDGLAVRMLYDRTADGSYVLTEAATRGDGAVGEDVTHNALHGGIAGLRQGFSLSPWDDGGSGGGGGGGSRSGAAGGPAWVEVRGEVFMRTADLEQLNREQTAGGAAAFANARNAASGALRLLDSAECRRRRLSFVAYAAMAPPPPQAAAAASTAGATAAAAAEPLHASHWHTLEWLKAAAFHVSPDNRLCDSPVSALARAEEWMGRRAQLGYDADGVVVKLDDTTQYGRLGTAGSDPRWAVAWKFPAGEAVTRLAGVELAVGRQGQVTPVALLEPVSLGGVTIRRATLHNVGRAQALGLHAGDAVVLRRSGDVIPQVMRVLPELRPAGAAPWRPPSACPACGGRLRREAGLGADAGDQLFCDNTECLARGGRAVLHFATVCLKGSNVAGGAVPALVEAGLLRSIADWYSLDEAALSSLPAFGPARRASLSAALASSRSMPAAKLLRGLSIRLVGDSAAAALGRAFPSLADLAAASAEEVQARAGVGPAVATSVVDWFRTPANMRLLQRLHEAGVQCVQGRQAAAAATAAEASAAGGGGAAAPASSSGGGGSGGGGPGPLVGVSGLTVCVTGTLQGPDGTGMKRSEMQALLERCGAEFHSSVKRNTQILVVGADAGTAKPADAARKGVRVMREEEFWREYGAGGGGAAAATPGKLSEPPPAAAATPPPLPPPAAAEPAVSHSGRSGLSRSGPAQASAGPSAAAPAAYTASSASTAAVGSSASASSSGRNGSGGSGGDGPGPLVGVSGVTVCVTGTLQGPDGSGMKRSEMQALLERCGAEFHSSVKRDTQILVVGADAGTAKPADAARKGVRVMREEEFWREYGA